jgi:hypothetical protein
LYYIKYNTREKLFYIAPSGNRTQDDRLEGDYVTTTPTALHCIIKIIF